MSTSTDREANMTTASSTILKPNLALLIDAENISAVHIPMIMEKINDCYGHASVRRAYGDWTTPLLNGWKKALEASALRPIQQFRHIKGKNSSDAALMMDAMELMHAREVDGFCIVSSDSDFTGLAGRIREKRLWGCTDSEYSRPCGRSWLPVMSSSSWMGK